MILIVCYLLQTTLFQALAFASISPNLMIIAVAAFGFMRGKKEGIYIGFTAGLIMDLFGGGMVGVHALLYMYIGYFNGYFRKMFYPEDVKLPMVLIAGSDLLCNLLIYFFLFLFRGRFYLKDYFFIIKQTELVDKNLITNFFYVII